MTKFEIFIQKSDKIALMMYDADLIAYDFMTDFNGPSRHFPNPMYPSGMYDSEKPVYNFGPESSKYPNMRLPYTLQDEWGNVIPDGFYMVVLSDDRKYLDLYQSNRLRAKVKIVKLVEKMYTQEELDEEREIIDRLEKAKIKKKLKAQRKAEEDLAGFKERAAANSHAVIEDSGKGYYILKYSCNGKKATGIIQK